MTLFKYEKISIELNKVISQVKILKDNIVFNHIKKNKGIHKLDLNLLEQELNLIQIKLKTIVEHNND